MTPRQRSLTAALAGSAAVAVLVAPVLAHAVVYPREVQPAAYEKFTLRVPNERDLATTRVELAFPDAVSVVSLGEVPGWEVEVVSNADGRITGAVWTGTLPVQRFVEFPFVAVTPPEETRLRWDAIQVYADGERVAWAGPEGSSTPASFTLVRGAGAGVGGPAVMSGAALLVALVALGLALRRGH